MENVMSARKRSWFDIATCVVTGFVIGAAVAGGIVVLLRSKRFWGHRRKAVVADVE
jgi:hypothetical protein